MALTKKELQDQVAQLLTDNPEAAKEAGFVTKETTAPKLHEVDINEINAVTMADPVKRQAAWAAVNKALREGN